MENITDDYVRLIEGLLNKQEERRKPDAFQENIEAIGTLRRRINSLLELALDGDGLDEYHNAKELVEGAKGLLEVVGRDISRIENRVDMMLDLYFQSKRMEQDENQNS